MSISTSNFSELEARLRAYHKNKPLEKTHKRTQVEKAVALALANVREHSNSVL